MGMLVGGVIVVASAKVVVEVVAVEGLGAEAIANLVPELPAVGDVDVEVAAPTSALHGGRCFRPHCQ